MRQLTIATGTSRKDIHWKNKKIKWDDLISRLSKSTATDETAAEYHKASKDERDRIKDIGGFVGGALTSSRRKLENFAYRDLLTLDIDNASEFTWEDFTVAYACSACVYSTHSSTDDHPRLRLIVPLSRSIDSQDAYTAICRRVSEAIGLDTVDPTSFRAVQMMYWPSHPKDAKPIYHVQTGDALDVDAVLSTYRDWHNVMEWPLCPSETEAVSLDTKKKAEDPEEKRGIVGDFCRTYSVAEAIDTYLSDIYLPGSDGRYTYAKGTSANGLVIFDDGKLAFSHHATDPAAGHAQNAFDLVRIHLYGDKDASIYDPSVRPASMPSYKAMQSLCESDSAVTGTIAREQVESAMTDFADIKDDMDWVKKLESDRTGIKPTINNYYLIIKNDPHLANVARMNLMLGAPEVGGSLPWDTDRRAGDSWTDGDDSALRLYVEKTYHMLSKSNCTDALNTYMNENAFHPVRDYLNSLVWDGKPRAETLLIDYLGADDNKYVRTVTRKTLVAAVARIFNPGCKFDCLLMLTGEQGAGKSQFVKRLGQQWFSDSVDTSGGQGKDKFDQLRGVWIAEDSELSSFKKADINEAKRYMSSSCDTYRKAFERNTTKNPRQCIFIGTTNTADFLHDITGGRRYWPVEVHKPEPGVDLSVWDDMTQEVVDQAFAEAVVLYKNGEKLYIDDRDVASLALQEQEDHTEEDPLIDTIREYLDKPIPEHGEWYAMTVEEHRGFLAGEAYYVDAHPKTEQRTEVSAREICVEALGIDDNKLRTSDIARVTAVMHNKMPDWEQASGRAKKSFGAYYGKRRYYFRKSVKVPH